MPPPSSSLAARPERMALGAVVLALFWRYAAHSVMVAVALSNEPRPAPSLPDLVLDNVPRIDWVLRHNYHVWALLYVPLALLLWRRDRRVFLHFLWVGGALSLVRALCIPLTGLGPPHGEDVNANASVDALVASWLAIVNPISALGGDAAHVGLTKDLFFSGHASTTLLLWLYVRRDRWLGPAALVAHVVVVASVFLAHLHYTIDVVGAWAITFSVWTLARARWPHGAELESRGVTRA